MKIPSHESFSVSPSPLQSLGRLREQLGGAGRVPNLWIKRDDLIGTGMGGNKLRKLEFLVAEALDLGCDTLVTAGAAQSNHCRLTGVVGAMCGLETHLCLRGPEPVCYTGNLVLNDWTGAHLHFTDGTQNVTEFMGQVVDDLRSSGRKPYAIPIGGSNPTGTLGYVQACDEALLQLPQTTHMVCATGSGGTQAGLLTGLTISKIPVQLWGVGVANPDTISWNVDVANLANATLAKLGKSERVTSEQIVCPMEWMGDKYGEATEAGQAALALLAKTEGIFLDPVYTAKAFAALLDWVREGRFAPTDTVLFWHTGGTPALFADGH